MKTTVHVDRKICMGTGLCQVTAPDIFKVDVEGHSVPIRPILKDSDDIDLARDAVDGCPLEAIRLVSEEEE